MKLSPALRRQLLRAQKNEMTEHFVYQNLANLMTDTGNKKILEKISADEKAHALFWQSFTKEEVGPSSFFIFYYTWISRIFGMTFGLRLMEKNESSAQVDYEKIMKYIPETKKIIADEVAHEDALILLLKEQKLEYIGSIVLGLNDALVELSGTLAGLTFALQNNQLISLAGLITGVAATCSMAASEYLSAKHSDETAENALTSAAYTGIAYMLTVIALVSPYFFIDNHFISLAVMFGIVVVIIAVFTFYISIAKKYSFKQRFFEMFFISFSVILLSLGIGYLVRTYLGVDV
ncbi:rubrerythrin family protein [Candidatus Peregrinibacteria bacterium]|nr:MAG: rubrerythrin family protein [Candidatus Peregrinibacteria bacterium]